MKPLNRYGPALVEYEGVADLTLPQESGIVYKGYFQAKQLMTGGIAIGFVPIAHDSSSTRAFTGRLYSEPSFHGRDQYGWDITTCGQTLVLPILGPLGAPKDAVHPASVFGSQCIKARSKQASDSGYSQARFRVSNLLWHHREEVPEPISLETGSFKVAVSPGDDYSDAADSIKAVRGVAPTAEVFIKTSDDSRLSLERYGDFMNDLVSVFRLATGNRVDWYYGEALEVGTEESVERFHKDAVTGPFSKMIRFRRLRSGEISAVPKLNFEALAKSFLYDDKQILNRKTLKELINYFINACDETSYLEARGLLASTLLDLIVLKYTQDKAAHNVVEERAFKKQVLPTLEKAITSVAIPEFSKELQTRAKEQLLGAFRRSFRQRLELLAERLSLPFDDQICQKAVKIRNRLVHDGTYLPDDDWYGQYRLIIWMDLVALCRLTGYEGDLPSLTESSRLEV